MEGASCVGRDEVVDGGVRASEDIDLEDGGAGSG
jgi:hypothetical protein